MQRKILPVTLENDSMTKFNNVRVEEDKLNFELSYIYAMNKNHAAPKNAGSNNKMYERLKPSR